MNITLLELDRVPTLEELHTFFAKNDFSAAAYIDIDYNTMDADTVEAMEHIKGLMDEHWEPLSREMGLKSPSCYYGKDNPLIAMRDNMENLAASGVIKLLEEQLQRAEEILAEFMDDPNIEQNADAFLHNAVKTLMEVMNYQEVAKVVQDQATYEDFNHDKKSNFRAKDFNRKWNHTRAAMQTVSLDELHHTLNNDGESEGLQTPDLLTDIFEEVAAKLAQENFWGSISEDDKKLLRMRMQGMSQKEIADALGLKTHSAVTKRLQKLKALFEQCA